MNTQEILEERKNTHGEFRDNANIGQDLKEVIRGGASWERRTNIEREAIEFICSKLARWVSAPAYHEDNPADIAGYSHLVIDRMEESEEPPVTF